MAISSNTNRLVSYSIVSRIHTLINLHRLCHTLARHVENSINERQFSPGTAPRPSCFDTSTWRVIDSRAFGLDFRKISPSSLTVLNILRRKGFQAYLVGGCVRDLLLNKIPKDFDVITDADNAEIEKQFNRAWVVGQEFPICQVYIKGEMVEVSSFRTVARHSVDRDKVSFSQRPFGCDKKNFVRWRNCLDRDFTINSLFYDPSVNKIYDYAKGMEDLRMLKVQTVVPAQMSFREDCVRILRGIRIAARLGLSFSDETASAIHNLYLSVGELNKSRLMREMNFMFSYGAAASSLYLLKKFNILDILLPVHAAYLTHQAHNNQTAENPVMLYELFSSMDKLLGCDRPSENSLWVALLAFHLALLTNPQDAFVIWAFSSVLYQGNWDEAVKFAREKAQMSVTYSPEILEACCLKSDEALVQDVTCFASLVKSCAAAMSEPESLVQSMAIYPNSPCSGLVFISNATSRKAAKIFDVRLKDENMCTERERFWINYKLLGKGHPDETRFVLGKIIMETMNRGAVQEERRSMTEEVCGKSQNIIQKAEMVTETNLSRNSYSRLQDVVYRDDHPSPVYNSNNHQPIKDKHHLAESGTGLRAVFEKCYKSQHEQVIKEKNLVKLEVDEKCQQGVQEKHFLSEPNLNQQQVERKHGRTQPLQSSKVSQPVFKERRRLAKPNAEQEKQVNDKLHIPHKQVVKEKTYISEPNKEQEQLNDKRHKLHHQVVKKEERPGQQPESSCVQHREEDNKRHKTQHQQASKENHTPELNLKQQQVVNEKRSRPLSSLFM